jgi:putative ABC transport system permease protein
MINTITLILAAFAAISLVVSSIMIGIITYVSVVERTKEIGIMRAIGARKKDVSRIFNAEALLIGFAAGLFGIVITYLLCIPATLLVSNLVGFTFTILLPIEQALLLILLSMGLTFVAGLFPSKIAAKKDPVVALRTE